MSLTNAQYEAIMREYSRRQQRNERDLMDRRARAYAAIPELSDLDAAVSRQGAALARKAVLEGPGPSGLSDSFRRSVGQAREQRSALLARHGFPADYLLPRYTCADCRDTGLLSGGGPGTSPSYCHCFRQLAIDLLYTQSGLREVLGEENFDHFSLGWYSDTIVHPVTGKTARRNMEENLAVCRQAIQDFDTAPASLFFYGDTGLGKTFLSHCIAKELLETSHSVMYYSAFELFELLARDTFGADKENGSRLDHLFSCDLLIIDDLGTELTNNFVSSRLFLLINERLKRPVGTIISTNLSLSAFAELYSERIFSRITSTYRLLNFFGSDIRIQKKLGGSANAAVTGRHQKS